MAQDNSVNLPGGFGGLTRYTEEYTSFINLKPTHVIILVVLMVALRAILPFFFSI